LITQFAFVKNCAVSGLILTPSREAAKPQPKRIVVG
jgi:hypothetical protein